MNTTYFLKLVSGAIFGKLTTPAIPATFYIGVSTTAPTIAGTGVTEPVGKGYSRIPLVNSSVGLNAPDANAAAKNKVVLTWAESTAPWGKITHYAVYDAATAGNLLMYDVLTEAKTIDSNTTLMIKAGELSFQVSNS